MNCYIFLILIKINSRLDFRGIHICNKIHFIFLKVNGVGLKLGPQVRETTIKGKGINFNFIHLILSFHYVSSLIHHSFLEDYFVWHLYMFIFIFTTSTTIKIV